MLLTNDDNPPGDSLASPSAQGDHRPSKAQAEGQTSLQRQKKLGQTLRAHLFAMAITSFRVGCCAKLHLHHIFDVPLCLTALLSSSGDPGQVRFDSDSFPISVDNHASYCMANSPHLFKILALSDVGKVDGINGGVRDCGQGHIQVQDRGRQWQGTHHPHPQLALLT